MSNTITVGLGVMKVTTDPDDVLVAYGLGSCIGVALYDSKTGVSGMLHALLPEHTKSDQIGSTKYVDTGMDALLTEMEKQGAQKENLVLKIAGGANMLNAPGLTDGFKIGERNIAAVMEKIATIGLKITAKEIGGHVGRTFRLYSNDGRTTIRTMGKQEVDI